MTTVRGTAIGPFSLSFLLERRVVAQFPRCATWLLQFLDYYSFIFPTQRDVLQDLDPLFLSLVRQLHSCPRNPVPVHDIFLFILAGAVLGGGFHLIAGPTAIVIGQPNLRMQQIGAVPALCRVSHPCMYSCV